MYPVGQRKYGISEAENTCDPAGIFSKNVSLWNPLGAIRCLQNPVQRSSYVVPDRKWDILFVHRVPVTKCKRLVSPREMHGDFGVCRVSHCAVFVSKQERQNIALDRWA